MSEVVRVELEEKYGTYTYTVKLIHEFGQFSSEYRDAGSVARKVSDLWVESSQHDVLFSDFTRGDPEAFMDMFFDPKGVWLEIERQEDHRIVGAAYMTTVLPNIDAIGHFTLWDSKGKGREKLLWALLEWAFDRYNLRRMSVEVPAFQRGLMRFLKRLGFRKEGVRRKARLHKGSWMDDVYLGMLKEELEEAQNGRQ